MAYPVCTDAWGLNGLKWFEYRKVSNGERSRAVGQAKGTQLSSGSDQAQEGRLVDALAIRGDEGRDTLR